MTSRGVDTSSPPAAPLPDLGRRVAPFAVAASLPFLLTLLFEPHAGSPEFIASAALTAALIVIALLFPWGRVPPALRAAVPLSYYVVVFLLRDSSTTAAAVYTTLVLLPVIWLALYGDRGQLLIALVCLVLNLIIPILAIGAPQYPASEWRRVAVYLAIAPIVGLTIHRLVTETRVRADRQRRVEQALRESETRHRLLVQNLPDALISLYDRELRLLLVEGPMLGPDL
jgi:hypothetical protein